MCRLAFLLFVIKHQRRVSTLMLSNDVSDHFNFRGSSVSIYFIARAKVYT